MSKRKTCLRVYINLKAGGKGHAKLGAYNTPVFGNHEVTKEDTHSASGRSLRT